MNRQHYSYTHYASKDVAAGFDQLRFSGPIGEYLLETQESLLMEAFKPLATHLRAPRFGGQASAAGGSLAGASILDVGTGTGRAAIGLARAGATVIGVDASSQMLEVARERAAAAGVSVTFDVGDAHALPFSAGHISMARFHSEC